MRFFTHAQIRNGLLDSNQILHIDFMRGHSDILETVSILVQGFWRDEGAKFGFSHWL